MLLGKEEHLIVQEIPIPGLFADCDNGNEQSRGCSEIGRLFIGMSRDIQRGWILRKRKYLSCLLLQHQKLVNSTLNISLERSMVSINNSHQQTADMAYGTNFCQLLGFRDELVSVLGKVLVRLRQRHYGEVGKAGEGKCV